MSCNTRVLSTAALVLMLTGTGALGAGAQERTGGTGHAPQGATAPSPFLGGVPHGEATATPMPLSLREAVDQGLLHNLGVLLQEQGLESARGSRWESLSGLLPDVSARISEARRVTSLAEFGFTTFPGLTSRTIGPFNVFDSRVVVSPV